MYFIHALELLAVSLKKFLYQFVQYDPFSPVAENLVLQADVNARIEFFHSHDQALARFRNPAAYAKVQGALDV